MRHFGYIVKYAALFLLLTAALGACKGSDTPAKAEKKESKNRPKLVQVSVMTVQPCPIRDILILPGETEPWMDVTVAADIAGRVEWVGIKEGSVVKKGELMAKIDVSALKAALDKAEASAKLAEEVYRRRKKLFERRIVTQENLDRSKTKKTVAYGNLKQARVEYQRGFVRAPITGLVNHLYVDRGEFVNRGQAMVNLVNVDKLKVNVDVPELDVKYLKVGQIAGVRVDAFPGRDMLGTISFVSFKADPATKTFLVRVLIDNPNHEVRAGMIARVAFLRRVIPDAISVPLFALADKGGERLVFVEKDGVVQARTVSLGVIEGDRIQITKGLNPGDHLIVAGQNKVEEGMRVKVR